LSCYVCFSVFSVGHSFFIFLETFLQHSLPSEMGLANNV
jgi:hypothetical protein